MTLEQKNFLLGFLELSGVNKEVKDFEMDVRKQVSNIIDLLPKEDISKGIKLESDLLKLLELLKWSYLSYGVSAKETLEDWNLEWTPEKVEISVNEEIRKIA